MQFCNVKFYEVCFFVNYPWFAYVLIHLLHSYSFGTDFSCDSLYLTTSWA